MYISVRYLDVKLNQDYADFIVHDDFKSLVLCDGIGEFSDSGKLSQKVVEQFINNSYHNFSQIVSDNEVKKLLNSKILGGTTFISAVNSNNSNKLKLEYLGNGGIIHFHGDFYNNPNTNIPFRYGELMVPHITANGALTNHISHNSESLELNSTQLEITLNANKGDIILLFSDGISSLEEKLIIQDNNKRYWRVENPSIQFIIKELNSFLVANHSNDSFDDAIINFNKEVLDNLKDQNYLEDDASLGLVVTEQVLSHYKKLSDD